MNIIFQADYYQLYLSEAWGFHGGKYVDYGLLDCNVQYRKW
jgi:hypothetical protein